MTIVRGLCVGTTIAQAGRNPVRRGEFARAVGLGRALWGLHLPSSASLDFVLVAYSFPAAYSGPVGVRGPRRFLSRMF